MKQKELERMRGVLAANGLDGYIISTKDKYFTEYSDYDKNRIYKLTGFYSGIGWLLITKNKVSFYTASIYEFEAKQGVFSEFEVYNIEKDGFFSDVANIKIGYTGDFHSVTEIGFLTKHAKKKNNTLLNVKDIFNISFTENDDSKLPTEKVIILDQEYTGVNSEKKIGMLLDRWQPGADFVLISDQASVLWLLNIRGRDTKYTPFVFGFLLISKNPKIDIEKS